MNESSNGGGKSPAPVWLQIAVALIAALALLWWGISTFFPNKTPTYETSFHSPGVPSPHPETFVYVFSSSC